MRERGQSSFSASVWGLMSVSLGIVLALAQCPVRAEDNARERRANKAAEDAEAREKAEDEMEVRERAEGRKLRVGTARKRRGPQPGGREPARQLTPEMLEYLNARMREDRERPRPLGQSLRIEFRITGGEGEVPPCSVWCSTDRFEISTHMGNDDQGLEFEAEGRLRITDAGILVEYRMEYEFRGNGGGIGAEAESSIVTEPGKNVELMRVGDRTVVLLIQRQAREF